MPPSSEMPPSSKMPASSEMPPETMPPMTGMTYTTTMGMCPPCKTVMDAGTLSGTYDLQASNDMRCEDGCRYKHAINMKEYCFDSNGKYETLEYCDNGMGSTPPPTMP